MIVPISVLLTLSSSINHVELNVQGIYMLDKKFKPCFYLGCATFS